MKNKIYIYNTLTRKKEEFIPLKEGVLSMYNCGPTVYSYAHIGNMRTYIFTDLLRRVFKFNNYKINGVMNITDVGHLTSDGDYGDDKMAKAATEQKKTPLEIAEYYTNVFFNDLKKLNIENPEKIAIATDHISEMISYVEKLIKNGNAYETEDGIYFDIKTFDNYGKLSKQKIDEKKAGSRINIDTNKRNPEDFALWKKAEKNHLMQWPSPWGMGYPGWHIECSVMSQKYLGPTFDLHTGGVDHIPVHHENEIAQNECLTNQQSVNYWVHSEFMQVNNGKMGKSLNNAYTVSQLEEKGYNPIVFRYFCLNTHYRKKLNFTFNALDSSVVSYNRLKKIVHSHKNKSSNITEEQINKYKEEFINIINDDLNIPLALGFLWNILKEDKDDRIYKLALLFDNVFGLDLFNFEEQLNIKYDIPNNILELAEKRKFLKENKKFNEADKIRDEIISLGYDIKDTREGYKITKN